VQVDPIKPTLNPLGTKCLKLKYDEPPSKFSFKFNLRRYNLGALLQARTLQSTLVTRSRGDPEALRIQQAGAYTRPLLGSM